MYKKIIISTVLMILLLTPLGMDNITKAKESFTDLGSVPWAQDAIYFLNERDVINGYGNGQFGPNDNITRGQAALMLVRELYPNEKSPNKLTFSDVNPNSYYYNAIAVAVDHGIFNGNPNGAFKPDDPITRAATAKILAIAFNLTGTNGNFTDINDVPWATNYIKALASNNIVNGYGDNTFRPNNTITRAEFSVSFARVLDDKFKPKNPTPNTTSVPFLKDIALGMTKEQVKNIETATLINEEPTQLIYSNKWVFDLSAIVTYEFENNNLVAINIYHDVVNNQDDLELLEQYFAVMYHYLSTIYGEPTYLDTDWLDDYNNYALIAFWESYDHDTLLTTNIELDYTSFGGIRIEIK